MLESLAPFGQDASEPLLGLEGVRVVSASVVGGAHLKMQLEQDGVRCGAIAFNWAGSRPQPGSRLDLAAQPRISNFRGRRVELVVEDMRPAR